MVPYLGTYGPKDVQETASLDIHVQPQRRIKKSKIVGSKKIVGGQVMAI
jgi:hypothetical protein